MAPRQDRRLCLFTGLGFLLVWLDISLGHVSAGLEHPGMWAPLIFLPCAATVSMLTAIRAGESLSRVFRVICRAAVLIGILGFFFHFARLLKELKGAVQWEVVMRLMRYPPLLAPLAVSGLGVLGLLVNYPEKGNRKWA